MIRIETLHHADMCKTESHILEQLLWLHYLVSQSSKNSPNNGGTTRSPMKSSNQVTILKGSGDRPNNGPGCESPPSEVLMLEDKKMLPEDEMPSCQQESGRLTPSKSSSESARG